MALPDFNNNPNIGDTKVVGNVTYVCVATSPDPQWKLEVSSNVGLAGQLGRYFKTFSTVSEMVALLTPLALGSRVQWLGYYQESDGGSGWGVVKQGAHIPDGGSIISINPTLYVEQNLKGKAISVKKFGAPLTRTVNATPAFQAAIDYMAQAGGGKVRFTDSYLIDTLLVVKQCVSLEGPLGLPDEILPGTLADYDSKQGVLFVNSGTTIEANDSASVSHCMILRKGLNLPFANAVQATSEVASFAGTALTVKGAGVYYHHLLILGFNRAIDSIDWERTRCEYVQGDCINGIRLRRVYDISYVENCHFWPWTTTHQSWTTSQLLTRPGTAYEYQGDNDWGKFTNCFSYGYKSGFVVDGCDHVNIIGCGADYVGGGFAAPDVIGIAIRGTSKEALIHGCQTAAQGVGVLIDTTAPIKNSHRIIGHNSWDGTNAHIEVKRGSANIIGGNLSGGSGAGVRLHSGTSGSVIGVDVADMSQGIVGADGYDYEMSWTTLANTSSQGAPSGVTENRVLGSIRQLGGQIQVQTIGGSDEPRYRLWRAGAAPNERCWEAVITAANEDFVIRTVDDALTSTQAAFIGARGTGNIVSESLLCAEGANRFGADATSFSPKADNAYSLGKADFRYTTLFSATGTINTSDVREKTDIEDASLGLDFISELRPVSYKWINGVNDVVPTDDEKEPDTSPKKGTRTHWGLIAQEVKETCDKFGVDFGGWTVGDLKDPNSRQGLRYDQFIAPLIKAIQELKAEIDALKSK